VVGGIIWEEMGIRMAVETATDGQFKAELVAVLSDLGENAEPWKLRPADDAVSLILQKIYHS
jgi:hypothetical protein